MPKINKEEKIVYISPPDDIMDVDKNSLLEIIDKYCLASYVNKKYPALWQSDVEDEADALFSKIYKNFEEKYKNYWIMDLSFGCKYDFKLPISIRFEVLEKLSTSMTYKLQPHELELFKKFLNTPEGQELEAWKWWEEYWNNRVTPEEE